jgi:isoleucyl-tRNA synthetase
LEEMGLSRQIASLGLGARNSANLKVRQPLAKVMVYAGNKRSLRPELVEIVTDELNVKVFEFVEEPRRLVTYRVLPDNKQLGPRFGSAFPKVRAAVTAADALVVAEKVLAGKPVMLEVDGQQVELAPEEVVVQTDPVAGLAVAAEHGITVAIDANLTPELRAEGLAREVVRRVQAMRKEAGFNIDDRIVTSYQFDGHNEELSEVMRSWSDYICAETLSTALVEEQLPEGAYSETHQIEGESTRLAVRKVQK